MPYNYLTLLLVTAISYSCNKPDAVKQNVFFVNDRFEDKPLKISDLFDSISYLKLETSKECLLSSEIEKYVIADGKIFIFDSGSGGAGAINAFSEADGRFEFKINRSGKGPGEYMTPEDFIVDEKRHQIEILDRMLQKILIYDHEGGFLGEFKVPCKAYQFQKTDEGDYLFYRNNRTWEGEKNNLVFWRKESSEIIEMLPIMKGVENFFLNRRQFFYQLDSSILLRENLSDKIYEFKDNELVERLHLNFGDRWMDSKFLVPYKDPKEKMSALRESKGITHINLFVPLYKGFCFIAYDYGNRGVFIGVGKDSIQEEIKLYQKVTNDLDHLVSNPLNHSYYSNGKQYNLISAIHLLQIYHERKDTHNIPVKVKEFIEGLAYDDNPVLMFLKPNVKSITSEATASQVM